MTDAGGKAVWEASYTPFGEAHVAREDVALALRLPGQYADGESGTHYNYLRDYDPGTGRYVTADPIELAGGPNGYAYASGSPLGTIDPLGLFDVPRTDAASDELIATLIAMDAGERRTYVVAELGSFADREDFYRWAHLQFPRKPEASQNDWFLAAAQVNELDALGAVDLPPARFLYDRETIVSAQESTSSVSRARS